MTDTERNKLTEENGVTPQPEGDASAAPQQAEAISVGESILDKYILAFLELAK